MAEAGGEGETNLGADIQPAAVPVGLDADVLPELRVRVLRDVVDEELPVLQCQVEGQRAWGVRLEEWVSNVGIEALW